MCFDWYKFLIFYRRIYFFVAAPNKEALSYRSSAFAVIPREGRRAREGDDRRETYYSNAGLDKGLAKIDSEPWNHVVYRLHPDDRRILLRIPWEAGIFLYSTGLCRIWRPPSLPFNAHRQPFSRRWVPSGMKLNDLLRLIYVTWSYTSIPLFASISWYFNKGQRS
jgi:hypothetical protein